jgi:hypothetical protein
MSLKSSMTYEALIAASISLLVEAVVVLMFFAALFVWVVLYLDHQRHHSDRGPAISVSEQGAGR